MKGWRTVTYNTLRAVSDAGIIAFLATVDWETAGLTQQTALQLVVGLSIADKVVNILLRMVTTTAIGKNH